MIKLIKKNDIKNQIIIRFPFTDGLICEYSINGKEKVFKRMPIAMAELLKDFGFIDSYHVTTEAVYVFHSPADENQRTDLIEDFMADFGPFHTLLFIAEFETRDFNRKEIAGETNRAKEKFHLQAKALMILPLILLLAISCQKQTVKPGNACEECTKINFYDDKSKPDTMYFNYQFCGELLANIKADEGKRYELFGRKWTAKVTCKKINP